jgi:hypothetical protein
MLGFSFSKTRVTLLSKLRIALLFSILRIVADPLYRYFVTLDIIVGCVFVFFACEALILSFGVNDKTTTGPFAYVALLLHSLSRQSIFILSDALAKEISITTLSSSLEEMVFLFLTTAVFVVLVTMLPDWFLRSRERGSLKSILLFTITSRFDLVRIPGLGRGMGSLVYGMLFMIFSSLDAILENGGSKFLAQLTSAASMISVNLFLQAVTPETTTQVIPLAILIGSFILSCSIGAMDDIAMFALWRTSSEINEWKRRIVGPYPIDQTLILITIYIIGLRMMDKNLASLLLLNIVQTVTQFVINTIQQLSVEAAFTVSLGILLTVDVFLS